LRGAASVEKGWVVVGLLLVISGLAGFQVTASPAYAQVNSNGPLNTSTPPLTDLPSDPTQNPLLSDRNLLIATPEPSPNDLDQTTQESSNLGGGKLNPNEQKPVPNTLTPSETIVDGQGPNRGETIGNSIVQGDLPENNALEDGQPGVVGQPGQPSQPSTDDSDSQDNTADSNEQEEKVDEEGDESNSEDATTKDEDEDEDEDEAVQGARTNDGVPLEYDTYGIPFP
jgi:hypothetical protein